MNVLKSLFPLVAVAGMLLASPGNAKACDAFFPTGQAFAFSNGGFAYGPQAFFAPAFVPSYGFATRPVFATPVFKAQAVVAAPAAQATIINERRGLFGRLRSREVIQATAGGGGASAQIINRR